MGEGKVVPARAWRQRLEPSRSREAQPTRMWHSSSDVAFLDRASPRSGAGQASICCRRASLRVRCASSSSCWSPCSASSSILLNVEREGTSTHLIYLAAVLIAATSARSVPLTISSRNSVERRGTFKDPNMLGAFLVPALLYAFNMVLTARLARARCSCRFFCLGCCSSFSRGAWRTAAALAIYAYLSMITAATNRQRVKLAAFVVLAGVLVLGVFAAAQTIPKAADLLGERATLEQSYDVGPEGRFGGQKKAADLVITHPLGIGALEFAASTKTRTCMTRSISTCSFNTGWTGGTLYLSLVLTTLALGFRQVVRDRGTSGVSRGGVSRHGARGPGDRHRSLATFLSHHGDDLGIGDRSALPHSRCPAFLTIYFLVVTSGSCRKVKCALAMPIHTARASIRKSVMRAWRPGT